MNIFIYGDSNTYGYVPNINGYNKNAVVKRYKQKDIWWNCLTKNHNVKVNALCGRAISKDNPWLENRNAQKTLIQDFKDVSCDLVIVMLGTNDCKSSYHLSANEIVYSLLDLINKIKNLTNSPVLIVSPPKIKIGTPITDKYYLGAEQKTIKIDNLLNSLAPAYRNLFVSGLDLEVGEDGEHLTKRGHEMLGKKVKEKIEESFFEGEL